MIDNVKRLNHRNTCILYQISRNIVNYQFYQKFLFFSHSFFSFEMASSVLKKYCLLSPLYSSSVSFQPSSITFTNYRHVCYSIIKRQCMFCSITFI